MVGYPMNLIANAGKNTDSIYLGAVGNKRSHLCFMKSSFLGRKYPLAICFILLTPSGFAHGSLTICLIRVNNSSCHLVDIYNMS